MSRRPIVAIDFDGTIVKHEYPAVGPLLPGAAETLRWLHAWADIVIWTCRYVPEDLAQARTFLEENGIPFDAINENRTGLGFQPTPKIYFDVGIDDRNLGGLPAWPVIRAELEDFKRKWE